jgi:Putative Flp pilus-assembly TadE/G-like
MITRIRTTASAISCDFARSLLSAIARFSHDEHGISAVVVAVALPGLIGFGALGAETGLWYTIKLQNQSAADAAAISAAYEVIAGKTNVTDDLTPAASAAATQNGYTGSNPAVIYPYSDSTVSNGVAVTLRQTQRALLASMFLSGVSIATKAVAVIEVLDNPCILALSTSGTDIEVNAASSLDLRNCSAAANSTSSSSVDIQDSTGSITAATLVTPGEISLQGNAIDPAAPSSEFILTSRPMIGARSIADPYAGRLTHTFLTTGMPTTGSCKSSTTHKVKTYSNTNCIITELSIKTGQTVDLLPGTYWITGYLTIASSGVLQCSKCVNGAGVTIILIAHKNKIGYVTMASNATIDLNAPSSGPFAGLVFVQDSNGLPNGTTYTSTHSTFSMALSTTLNGLVYFPNSSITVEGNLSATGSRCLLLVVDTVTFNGTFSLETLGCASAGLTNLPTINTVALAE